MSLEAISYYVIIAVWYLLLPSDLIDTKPPYNKFERNYDFLECVKLPNIVLISIIALLAYHFNVRAVIDIQEELIQYETDG